MKVRTYDEIVSDLRDTIIKSIGSEKYAHARTYDEIVSDLRDTIIKSIGSEKYAHWCSLDGHEAVQNGTQKSWCKHCDIDMVFEWKENKYVVVHSRPAENMDYEVIL